MGRSQAVAGIVDTLFIECTTQLNRSEFAQRGAGRQRGKARAGRRLAGADILLQVPRRLNSLRSTPKWTCVSLNDGVWRRYKIHREFEGNHMRIALHPERAQLVFEIEYSHKDQG